VTSHHPLLGAYAAKTCARAVHNDHDVTMGALRGLPAVDLSPRLEAGRAFDVEVRTAMAATLGADLLDLTDAGLPRSELVRATLDALDAGTAVVAGGQLPDDLSGRRRGRPDLLVRVAAGGYAPVEIKGHKALRDNGRTAAALSWAPRLDPTHREEVPGVSVIGSADDLIQLAHYRRMLEACGHACDEPLAGVIGTDCLADGIRIAWSDLSDERFLTFSRSEGSARRSALTRYDHEFAFRLAVLDVAASRTGTDADAPPLVAPVWQEACGGCVWHDACRAELDGTLAVELLPTALDVREWTALRAVGFETPEDFAGLSLDDPRLDPYWVEVTHRADPRGRLQKVIDRAGMVLAGERVRRTRSGPVAVPRGVVEVDFDIEWTTDERVYLWGLLITRPGQEPVFEPIVSWDLLDDAAESDLARRVVERFLQLRAEAAALGGDLRIYHYTRAEIAQLTRIASRGDADGLTVESLQDSLADFVDLYDVVKSEFVGTRGLGLKVIATYGAGFTWRDDDPGGLQSQQWWVDAVQGSTPQARDAARSRVLEYNEDDVLATWHLRRWLATLA